MKDAGHVDKTEREIGILPADASVLERLSGLHPPALTTPSDPTTTHRIRHSPSSYDEDPTITQKET